LASLTGVAGFIPVMRAKTGNQDDQMPLPYCYGEGFDIEPRRHKLHCRGRARQGTWATDFHRILLVATVSFGVTYFGFDPIVAGSTGMGDYL
jgi:hypothetical protein